MNPNTREDPPSVLGPSFWSSAPIPAVAILLGFAITPTEHYDTIAGVLIPIGVYGFTGVLAAALSFLAAVLLLFPTRLGSLTFMGRVVILLVVGVFTCAAALYVGYRIMSQFHHLVL